MRKLLLGLTLAIAMPAAAQPAPPTASAVSPALEAARARMPRLFNGELTPDQLLSASFLAQVSAAQVTQMFAQLRERYGRATGVTLRPVSANTAYFTILYERGRGEGELKIDGDGRIAEMLIRQFSRSDDSVDRVGQELAALHGAIAWGLYRLDGAGVPQRIAGTGNERELAIGSAFKLAILGALDAEVAAGRRRWSDVVTLDAKSFPSGRLQDWPIGAPMTLHTAAAMMISISDNTATDLLIRTLGRDEIERFAAAHGGLSANVPLLTTVEAGVLKNPASPLRTRWLAARTSAERRAVLASAPAGSFAIDRVDIGALDGDRPGDIDRTEWFASPNSIARLLGWFATRGSADARAILGISPTLARPSADGWRYVGFKGGSETGVVSSNALVQDAAGRWGVLSMHWNDTTRAVDNSSFVQLSTRALDLLRAELARTPAR